MPLTPETTAEIRRLKHLLEGRKTIGLKDRDNRIYQQSDREQYRRILSEDFGVQSARELPEPDALRLIVLLQTILSDSIFNERELANWTLKRWQCWQCGEVRAELLLHNKFPNRYGWYPECHCPHCSCRVLHHYLDYSEWQANTPTAKRSKKWMEKEMQKS